MYIRSAITIQALIRGFVTRQWLKYVKVAQIPSALQIQRIMRGWLGRIKVTVLRHRMYAARNIQRMFRGHQARIRATTAWIQVRDDYCLSTNQLSHIYPFPYYYFGHNIFPCP